MSNLKTESLKACANALNEYNFTKKKHVYVQPGRNPAATGCLGLLEVTRGLPVMFQINPIVGVRHLPLEAALAELAGRPAPQANVSRSIEYLTSNRTYTTWDFPAGGDLTAIAKDLAKTVDVYGRPFIDKWSDWETFSTGVAESGLLLDAERPMVLPLVAAINGDRSTADRLIQQELDRVGDAPDVYSKSYREFARRFASKIF